MIDPFWKKKMDEKKGEKTEKMHTRWAPYQL